MSKWISVRERLPEPFKEVEVVRRGVGGNLFEETGYFDLRKLQWRANGKLTRRVTHWREKDHGE